MDEIARVEQMVAEGLITAEEGERLKAVLRSVQEADELEAPRAAPEGGEGQDARLVTSPPSGDQAPALVPPAPMPTTPLTTPLPTTPVTTPSTPTTPQRATPPSAAVPPAPGANAPRTAVPAEPARPSATDGARGDGQQARSRAPKADDQAGEASAPAGTRWVRVDVVAGDLDVHVDPGLSEPKVTSDSGEATLEATDYGYRVALGVKGEGFFLRNLEGPLAGLLAGRGRPGDVKLTLPAGFGIDLVMTTGDVDLHGVPYLRGSLSAGDLDAYGLEGIDLSSLAGDVSVSLRASSGRHRILNTAGELKVVLLPGSDVTVNGDVSIGEVKAGPEFTTGRRLMSGTVTGTLGAGVARLDLKVTAGSIKLRTGTDDRG